MQNYIPYGKQYIDDSDVEAVVQVLKSDYLTQGPFVEKFEKAICQYTGAKYCVVVSSATAALHIAIGALDLNVDDEGITSPNTFVATSNSLIYNGLKPVFADINPDSLNINPRQIENKITKKTKLILPVHFAGYPCQMIDIKKIADQNKLYVIEDAAHAIGSHYDDGSKVGNCRYSSLTIFSFHPVKTMTTGEGGAITTNDEALYSKLLLLRSHGITKDQSKIIEKKAFWYYEMQALGFNYRMTDIQAALGFSQLQKIEIFKARRKEIVTRYNKAFSELSWLQMPMHDKADTCFHLYVLQIDYKRIGKNRQQVIEELLAKGIGTQVHYIPVHTQPYYKQHYGYQEGDYPCAESYYQRALSIPLFPKMTGEEIERVIEGIINLKR